MEEYGHAESMKKLRNRTYFSSLGWDIRKFSILIRTRGAGQKVQPVSSNKDSSLQKPRENASLSKLQCITSRGDCHLPFLTKAFDISKSCLFYNVSFKSVTVYNNYNYAFSLFYVTSSATSREVFPSQQTLKYVEKSIEKRQCLLLRRCKVNTEKILLLVLPYSTLNSKFMMNEIMST
jgi:hypothetical protein